MYRVIYWKPKTNKCRWIIFWWIGGGRVFVFGGSSFGNECRFKIIRTHSQRSCSCMFLHVRNVCGVEGGVVIGVGTILGCFKRCWSSWLGIGVIVYPSASSFIGSFFWMDCDDKYSNEKKQYRFWYFLTMIVSHLYGSLQTRQYIRPTKTSNFEYLLGLSHMHCCPYPSRDVIHRILEDHFLYIIPINNELLLYSLSLFSLCNLKRLLDLFLAFVEKSITFIISLVWLYWCSLS